MSKKELGPSPNIRAFLFDVDKTLTNTERVVTKRTQTALRSLAQKGYLLGVCTGRGYARTYEQILPLFPDDSLHILSAGSQVMNAKGEVKVSHSLPVKLSEKLLQKAVREEVNFVFDKGKKTYGSSRFVAEWGLTSLEELPDYGIASLAFYDPNDSFLEMLESTSSIEMVKMRSNATKSPLYEVTAKGVNKSRGVEEWAQLHGVQLTEIAGFGDSENDRSFLEAVGWAVAMGNAVPELKRGADITIGSTDEDGLAKYIEETWL